MQRRRFLVKASGALAAVGAAAVVDAPNVIAQPKIQWRMSTALAPSGSTCTSGAAQRLATDRRRDERRVGSGSRSAPGGQIMPPFECFDAASKGTIEAFMGSPQYWSQQRARARVVRDHPVRHEPRGHGRLVLPGRRTQALGGGATPPSTSCRALLCRLPRRWPGGSGRRSTRSADYKGLKMRIPNLGGKVIAQGGRHDGAHPGGEIYAALERGVIDACGVGRRRMTT